MFIKPLSWSTGVWDQQMGAMNIDVGELVFSGTRPGRLMKHRKHVGPDQLRFRLGLMKDGPVNKPPST